MTWDGETLAEVVYKMVREGKAKSPEFQKLVQFFGREHLLALYEEERGKHEQQVSKV